MENKRLRQKMGTVAVGAIAIIVVFMIVLTCIGIVIMESNQYNTSVKYANEAVATKTRESLAVVQASSTLVNVTNEGSTPVVIIGFYRVNPADNNPNYVPLSPATVPLLSSLSITLPQATPENWKVGVVTSLGNVFWEEEPVQGGTTETVPPGEPVYVTFTAKGLGSDASGTVLTVDGSPYTYSQLPKTFQWVSGSTHSFSWSSPVSGSSGVRYVWASASGLSTKQSDSSFTVNANGYVIATYKTQYSLTMNVNPSGGGTTNPAPGTYWYDPGSAVSISATANSGYAFDQWVGSGTGSYTGTSASASVTVNAPITETAHFFTFSISVSPTSGSTPAGGSVTATVTVTYVSGVNSKTISLSASGLPSGASSSFSPSSVTISPSSPTATSTVTMTTSTSTPTGSFTVTIAGTGGGLSKSTSYTLAVGYAINFYVYDDAGSAVSGATINFAGSSYSHGGSTSVVAGSYSLSTGTIPSGYRFKQWETSGGVSVASSTSTSTTATVSGAGSITMRLQRVATVTFSASGLGSDASGTVLNVDGTGYAYGDLPKSFTWDVGSSHSFTWSDPVSSTTSGKRYAWVSTSGLSTAKSGSITVPAGGGSVSATYKTQYYLTVSSAYDSPTPTSGWFDAGTSITASVTSPVSGGSGVQYVCTGWSGSGSVPSSGTGTSVTFTINAPSSITWNWKTQYYLTMQASPSGGGTVSPGSGWRDAGTQVQISATPASGYVFTNWTGSGSGSYSGTANPATITMNGPITETAVFSSRPWLTGWSYRRPITITSTLSLSNYQILVQVNTASLISAGKMRSDGGDMRFTDSDGVTLLSYWIEPGTVNTANTKIWVKVPSIQAGSKTIYLYYGNLSATSQSNGDATFLFFDDFSGTSLDLNKWDQPSSSTWAGYTIENGKLVLYIGTHGKGEAWNVAIFANSKNQYSLSNTIIEACVSMVEGGSTYQAEKGGLLGIRLWDGSTDWRFGRQLFVNNAWLRIYSGSEKWRTGSWDGAQTPYKVLAIAKVGSTTYFMEDGVVQTSRTDVSLASSYVSIVNHVANANGDGWGEVYVDWIRVRNYVISEPTVTVGSEQSG